MTLATLARYLITRRHNPNYETAVREYHNSRTMEINPTGGNTMLNENMTSWAIATELMKAGYHIQHLTPRTRNRSDGFFDYFSFTEYHDNLVKHGSEYIPSHDMQND